MLRRNRYSFIEPFRAPECAPLYAHDTIEPAEIGRLCRQRLHIFSGRLFRRL